MNKTMTIEWHDLIEDPNDLPPVSSNSSVWSEDVYVQTKSGHRLNAAYRRGTNDEEGWYNETITKLNKNDIVAWTYVPKYYNREKRIDDLLTKLPNAMEFHRIRKGKTEVYPKRGQFIILFQYKDGEGIVSGLGFYDKEMGWMITPSIHVEQLINIDDVIGWSPFFKVPDNVSDSDKEKEVIETIKDENKENKNLSFPNYKTGYLSDVGSELYRKAIWNKFYNNDKVIMKPHIHNLMENPNDVPTKRSCNGVLIFAFSILRNGNINIITFPGWYDKINGVWKRSCNGTIVHKDMICGWADFQIYEKVAESKKFKNITLEVTCPRETSEKDEVSDSDEKE